VAVLVRHGVPVFYSRKSIRGAQQWHDEIGSALRRCDWFVVVLSPHSVLSRWVKRELLFALQADRYEARIVPLRLRRCRHDRLSWTLQGLQMIAFNRSFRAGCAELLGLWGMRYQPGAPGR
jgi:hypothetical protein